MAIRYPEGWQGLAMPQVRLELLEYLRDAGDPSAFRDVGNVESLVHFVFDDHDFSPDRLLGLGAVLKRPEEAQALASFVTALDVAIGPRSRPLAAVNAQDWEPVARAARIAHATLAALGLPVFE